MDSTYVETPPVETQNFASLQPRSNNLPKGWKWVKLGEVVHSMPIRLTQNGALGYDPVHIRLPPDTVRVSDLTDDSVLTG